MRRTTSGHRAMAWLGPIAVLALLAVGCARPAASAADPTFGSSAALGTTTIAQTSTVAAATTSAGSTSSTTPTPSVPGCDPASIPTRQPGVLAYATGPDLAAPWFSGSDPADGQGFEAAVATAVATRLGYPADQVSWTRVPTARGEAGSGDFDAYLGKVTIPDHPGSTVSYTTGYLDDGSVVLAEEGSKAVTVTTMSQLAALRVGSLAGQTVPDVTVAKTFDRAASAASGVTSGTVDVVLAPLSAVPDAIGSGGLQAIARVPDAPGWQARQLGMVLPAGSSVSGCLSRAIDMLRVDGTLAALAQQWLPASRLPVLADR